MDMFDINAFLWTV